VAEERFETPGDGRLRGLARGRVEARVKGIAPGEQRFTERSLGFGGRGGGTAMAVCSNIL
jgi:hypothetical protein